MRKYAIIDLGSNSARLHIYHLKEDGSYYLLESVKEKVRLSEGMSGSQMIQDVPLQRTLNTLKLFTSLIKAHEIELVFPLATAAIRNSKNQEAVLNQIRVETGLVFQVLSGEEEARYDFLGVINSIDMKDFVLLDVGGGSAEIVWVKNRTIVKAISIPFGSVNLTESYIDKFGYKVGIKRMEKALKEVIGGIEWIKKTKGLPIIGLGGAIRTLAKVDRLHNQFPIYSVHNYRMDEKEFQKAYQLITDLEPKDVDNLPGVSKKRADVIQGGLVPLKVLMEEVKCKSLIISENGLREGFFYKCLSEHRGSEEAIFENVLEESILNHMKRLKIKTNHAHNVLHTVTVLFEALKASAHLEDKDLRILRTAALFHDVGLLIDYDMHHRHGFYMMMNMRLNGLTNKETTAVSYLIGLHRSAEKKLNTSEYGVLIDYFTIEAYEKYSAFLQLAEQLDRSESGRVTLERAKKKGATLQLTCRADKDVELEINYAMQVQPAFLKHFGLTLVIDKVG